MIFRDIYIKKGFNKKLFNFFGKNNDSFLLDSIKNIEYSYVIYKQNRERNTYSPIGLIILREMMLNSPLHVGIFILDKYRNKGYGKKAVDFILSKHNNLYFNVDLSNIAALKLLFNYDIDLIDYYSYFKERELSGRLYSRRLGKEPVKAKVSLDSSDVIEEKYKDSISSLNNSLENWENEVSDFLSVDTDLNVDENNDKIKLDLSIDIKDINMENYFKYMSKEDTSYIIAGLGRKGIFLQKAITSINKIYKEYKDDANKLLKFIFSNTHIFTYILFKKMENAFRENGIYSASSLDLSNLSKGKTVLPLAVFNTIVDLELKTPSEVNINNYLESSKNIKFKSDEVKEIYDGIKSRIDKTGKNLLKNKKIESKVTTPVNKSTVTMSAKGNLSDKQKEQYDDLNAKDKEEVETNVMKNNLVSLLEKYKEAFKKEISKNFSKVIAGTEEGFSFNRNSQGFIVVRDDIILNIVQKNTKDDFKYTSLPAEQKEIVDAFVEKLLTSIFESFSKEDDYTLYFWLLSRPGGEEILENYCMYNPTYCRGAKRELSELLDSSYSNFYNKYIRDTKKSLRGLSNEAGLRLAMYSAKRLRDSLNLKNVY